MRSEQVCEFRTSLVCIVKETEKERRRVGGRDRRREGERKVQVFTDWTLEGGTPAGQSRGSSTSSEVI